MLRQQARLPFLTLAHELGAMGNYLPLGIFAFFFFLESLCWTSWFYIVSSWAKMI